MERGDQRLVAIVDDEIGVRNGLKRLLRSAGYVAVAYESGAGFLAAASELRPDCLILDLRMADMDGFEVIARLGAEGPEIPIIVLTSFPSEETRRRALEAGAALFLEKPADRAVLLEAIERTLAAAHRPASPRDPACRDPDHEARSRSHE